MRAKPAGVAHVGLQVTRCASAGAREVEEDGG
jgi:hypothetical protein